MSGRVVGAAAAVALAVLAAGCGPSSKRSWAQPQVVQLGWRENCGTRARPLPIQTRRLVVGARRWRVELAFQNRTGTTLGVVRPHFPGDTYFGLSPYSTTSPREILKRAETAEAKPRTIADRYRPSKPRLISPGERWSGWFSGPGRLPSHAPIRVVLGRFVIEGTVPRGFSDGFLCVSRRYVRLS